MRAAVYTFVHSHNVCDAADLELSDRPHFCNRKINTAKDFRKALIFMHDSVSCANGFWSRKFGLEIDEHIWSIPLLVTKETMLRVLHWKILHNIDPTNILLCKMKVRDDQMCSYCNDVVNCIQHFFFKTKRINHVIFIAKLCISMYTKTNAFLPLSMIFENQLKFRNL